MNKRQYTKTTEAFTAALEAAKASRDAMLALYELTGNDDELQETLGDSINAQHDTIAMLESQARLHEMFNRPGRATVDANTARLVALNID